MSPSQNKDDNKNEGFKKLINCGAEIAGGAIGGALGFLAGGPVGAAALGAGESLAAMALKQIGQETSERFLGPREKVRIGGVLAIAAVKIKERIENGDKIRTDGFFENRSFSGRSDAEEVTESILLKSQREPEEKKIPYMGYLLANIAFSTDISPDMAHQLTKAAEQLTYRQLCILKLAVVKTTFVLKQGDYRSQGSFNKNLYQILYECIDLYHRGFLNFEGSVAFGPTDIDPSTMTIQGIGADLFNQMQLSLIPEKELLPITTQLQ